MGTMIPFKRPDGGAVQGYLAEPLQAAGAPGIVVIQEWWGVNGQIRGVADRLASAGYVALVPDLFRGKSTVEAEEAHHLMTALNFGDAAAQDVRGAVQFLRPRCGKVGVTGFCMGGRVAYLMVALVLVLSSPVMGGDAVSVADVPSAARNNSPGAWALDLLSETRDRPLFSLHRRPPSPPAVPPPNLLHWRRKPRRPTFCCLPL